MTETDLVVTVVATVRVRLDLQRNIFYDPKADEECDRTPIVTEAELNKKLYSNMGGQPNVEDIEDYGYDIRYKSNRRHTDTSHRLAKGNAIQSRKKIISKAEEALQERGGLRLPLSTVSLRAI